MNYKFAKDNEEKSILINQDKVNSDYWRQKYHIQGIVGLINDPNGFSQFNGKYHMFYQWNPLGTDHKNKTWAHSTSYDLLHWTREKTALRPDTWYSKNGVYSGSGFVHNGKLYLMYTGNVKNNEGIRESYQCIAISDDGINFDRWEPSIINSPEGYTRHIRDPKVWEKNGKFYAVLGAQSIEEKGKVLLYSSDNIKDWFLEGEIAGSNRGTLGDFGYMWECPDFFTLKDEITGEYVDVLVFSPQGIEPDGDLYNNKFQTGYLLGKLYYDIPEFKNTSEFVEMDRGNDFYAPQSMEDDKGRRIIVGWMGIPEEEDFPTVKNEWLHCLTLPRVLKLRDGIIYQEPIEEMKTIRGEQEYIKFDNNTVTKGKEIEIFKNSKTYELLASFKPKSDKFNGDILLKLRVNEDDTSSTDIKFDHKNKKLILDRSKGEQTDKRTRQVYLGDIDELKLNIFVDNSSVEIFVNDGIEVFSSRIFPKNDAHLIKIFNEADVDIEISKWEWI